MEQVEILLLIASLVAILCRRIKLPYTIGLVLAGLGLSLAGIEFRVHLSKELIFSVLLPPLIFEAALHLRWRDLKTELPVALPLATLGVALAAVASSAVLVFLAGQTWQTALIIGVVMSATDPVSILALLKESKLPPRIHRLIEAESILNDGTAAVLFTLALSIIAGSVTAGQFMTLSLTAIGLGLFIGAAIGFVALSIAVRTEDHLVELAVTTVAAYSSFIIAEDLHASGVLATLVAGMVLGNLGARGAITEKGHETTAAFWEFAGFVSNSIIFLLIGADLTLWRSGVANSLVLWTIIASVISRSVAVYIGCLPLAVTRHRVPMPIQNLLFFGGLRGALALALVLGLPAELSGRDEIISAVFLAVAFSVVVQGLTAGGIIARSTDRLKGYE
jgi:CPA1 family monovalent cation:H+ antiporter